MQWINYLKVDINIDQDERGADPDAGQISDLPTKKPPVKGGSPDWTARAGSGLFRLPSPAKYG